MSLIMSPRYLHLVNEWRYDADNQLISIFDLKNR